MVANLPYSIATPLLLRTIDELPAVERWTVMVQREIADRLRAAPGSRTYGSPSVLAQLACEVELLRTVDPAVFRPRPRVESAILGLRRTGPRRRPGDSRAGPRRLRPPPQVARPLARARPARAARAARATALARARACPRTPAPRRSRPSEFAALAAKLQLRA